MVLPALAWPRDPRWWQMAFQALLFGCGVAMRDFSIGGMQVLATFLAGLAAQAVWLRALRLRNPGYRSACITCFGLCLLLRADNPYVHPLAAALALSSKFLLRVRGKHVWNPANLGAMMALLVLPGAWVSPGQWGSDLAWLGWLGALGFWVALRAQRLDASAVFLLAWIALTSFRMWYFHIPWEQWLHSLDNGALLLFAFFMLSDPKTLPDHPLARAGFAGWVAFLAFLIQYWLFIPNGFLWSLFLSVPLVPLLDRLWPGQRYSWAESQPETGADRN